jgi:L-alanine-DL-glutamate epimerase-like enolase superfamily enzyme
VWTLGIPIIADESVSDHAGLVRLIKADAPDIVKVMKQGGCSLPGA